MLPEEAQDAIAQSIDSYASRVRGMRPKDILMSEYVPPGDIEGGDWLNMNDPNVEKYVDFWEEARDAWRARYGDMEGWEEFNNYWAVRNLSGVKDLIGDAIASEVFLGGELQSLRDQFGYANDEELYTMGPEEIALYGAAGDRGIDYERRRQERELAKAWQPVY